MSRFSEGSDWDDWGHLHEGRWKRNMRAVRAVLKGQRGKKLLKELEQVLLAMPEKRLIHKSLIEYSLRCVNDEGDLEVVPEYCALGAYGAAKGKTDSELWFYQDEGEWGSYGLAKDLGLGETLGYLIADTNDLYAQLTPERRYERVLEWVRQQL